MKRVLVLVGALLVSGSAVAHPGHGLAIGFNHGFMHPLSGLDHILAMVAVGLLAVQLGGRALWALPATFVGVMILGAVDAHLGVTLPLVEPGIVGSVIVLGGLLALNARLSLTASMTIVGLFALFHGYAHGIETPASAGGLAFGLGFVLATMLLHASGIAAGLCARRLAPSWLQVGGAAITCGGLLLGLMA